MMMFNFLEMSFMAAILIILIVIIRVLFLNRLPKITFPILWIIVLLRLIVPFSIESNFGLNTFLQHPFDAPLATDEPQENVLNDMQIERASQLEGSTVTVVGESYVGPVEELADYEGFAGMNWNLIFFIIWLIGVISCASYFTIGYLKSYQKIRTAVPIQDGFLTDWLKHHPIKRPLMILISDQITTPMTLGILKPKIILPEAMDLKPSLDLNYVLAHELCHIKRFDALWKLIVVIISCLHWFNPFVWIAVVFINRDLEISCDAWVLKKFSGHTKKSYAYALISLAEYQNGFSSLFSGFSRHATAERVESVMRSKKATTANIIVAGLAVLFFTFNAFAAPVASDEAINDSDPLQGVDNPWPIVEGATPIIPHDAPNVIELSVPAYPGSNENRRIRLQEFTVGEMTFLAGDLGDRHQYQGIVPEMSEDYLSFQAFATLSANAIFENFGVSSDGLIMDGFLGYTFESTEEGDIIESNSRWTGWLLSKDFSENPTGVPDPMQLMFHIQVCAVTGEILLIDDMRDYSNRARG